MLDEIVGMFKTELSALPARLTRDLALRRTLEAETDRVQGQVHDRLAAYIAALKETGEAVD